MRQAQVGTRYIVLRHRFNLFYNVGVDLNVLQGEIKCIIKQRFFCDNRASETQTNCLSRTWIFPDKVIQCDFIEKWTSTQIIKTSMTGEMPEKGIKQRKNYPFHRSLFFSYFVKQIENKKLFSLYLQWYLSIGVNYG